MRHFLSTRCLLSLCTLSFVREALSDSSSESIPERCDKNAVDQCVRGILFSAENDRTFFWKDVVAVEGLCDRVQQIPDCVKNATMDCGEGAQRFLKALMKGYEVLLQSRLCAKTPEGIVRRELFAKNSNCLREKFNNPCMKNYIASLEQLVRVTDDKKIRKACCLHRAYRVCLANSITPVCGVEAASGYIQLNSMLSAAPIREICGSAYAEDSCTDAGWMQATEFPDLKGSILSRLLQILIDYGVTEKQPASEVPEEALEYATCTEESIDECFLGVLPLTEANTSALWRTEVQMTSFCSRLHNVPLCLQGRAPTCRTTTNEILQLVKEEAEFTRNASFCQDMNGDRNSFVEGGRCVHENVDNNCTKNLVSVLAAVSKEPNQSRRDMLCCIATWYSGCLSDAIRPKCGEAVAEFYSSLVQRLALPGQTGCRCELTFAQNQTFVGTSMRSLVHALEEP